MGDLLQLTEKKRLLNKIGYEDKMTNLENRNSYEKEIQNYTDLKNKLSIGVIFFDLNGLKEANDSKGHDYGDILIKETSKFIHTTFKKDSKFRVGGDEFVVFVNSVTKKEFIKSIVKMKKALNNKKMISVSVGTAWGTDCRKIETLIIKADKEMYQNKMQYYKDNPKPAKYL
jgi:diguanylate cyclase (GGDEF)-like protein